MSKPKWTETFRYSRDYIWHVNRGNTYALEIPEHRVQSYFATSRSYVLTEYLLNVYVGKTDVMQEILFNKSNTNADFAPILPKVFHKLFPDMQIFDSPDFWGHAGKWWSDCIEYVEMDGRILLRFDLKDWRRFVVGVNLKSIDHTFAALLLRRFGPAISFACRYPDKINDLNDAARVVDAIKELSMLNYKRHGHYESEIERIRLKLKQTAREIEESNIQFDKTCNAAAEALNVLSDKFGIVVNV